MGIRRAGRARDRRVLRAAGARRLALSLTDFDIYALADLRNLRFVGLDNYLHLLRTPLFWQALGNTLYFVVVGVPLSIGLSLGAALLLHARVREVKPFFRTALFAPVVTTVVAVAVVWRYLLQTRYGMVNYALAGISASTRSTGWAIRTGDADHHPARGLEELRLQHDDLARQPAGRAARGVRGRPRRRRNARCSS
jgi:hypothetical protein